MKAPVWWGTHVAGFFLFSLVAVLLRGSGAEAAEASPGVSMLAFDRMGAGVPAGWRVEGDGYEWSAEAQAGPLGAGAARIRFDGRGAVTLSSPALRLRKDRTHAVRLLARSEPAGARISLAIRDNGQFPDGASNEALETSETVTDGWRSYTLQGALPAIPGEFFFLRFSVSGEGCTIWIDGLWLGEAAGSVDEQTVFPARAAAVVLTPESPWGLVTGDAPMRARVVAVGADKPGCRLDMRAVHTTGLTRELAPVALDDTGIWSGTVEVTGDAGARYGMVRLEATVADAGGVALSPVGETLLSRAPVPVPGPLEDSPFGIHVTQREPDLAVVSALGYKWCRIHDAAGSTKWGYIEPEPGTWIWYDDEVELRRRNGMMVLGMLDSSPPWASGVTHEGYWSVYGVPRNIDDWRNYVRRVVGHYAGSIDRWEVWNEPWNNMPKGFMFFQGGGPEEYVELLKAASEEAKQVNPNATIVGVDTYPFQWDQAVLALGAYPYYDVLSFHRYDHTLHGRPDDAIAFEAARLRAEQAKYGDPKPIELTEGGPDVSLYHGSFFSFADPGLTGDWSRNTDQYARMYLSSIANGIVRFSAYTVHGEPGAYGAPTHGLAEAGPLLRPMHLTVSALAQFVEGATYKERLNPTLDISAFVFEQPNARYFSEEPSTVVALIAHGEEPEPLPRPIPGGVRCFDRWGNPVEAPAQAGCSIVYLVATDDTRAALLESLAPVPPAAAWEPGVEGLVKALLGSLAQAGPPLWTLFSSQGSLAVLADDTGVTMANRSSLRTDEALAKRFRFSGIPTPLSNEVKIAGASVAGWVDVAVGEGVWSAVFSAVPEGGAGAWRFVTLAVAPRAVDQGGAGAEGAVALLMCWEEAVGAGSVIGMRETLPDSPFCALMAMPNSNVITRPDYFVTMLHGMVGVGMEGSDITIEKTAVADGLVMAFGTWDTSSPFTGPMHMGMTALMARDGDSWRLASLTVGPEMPPQ